MTQPSVSYAIKQLESTLGVKLFIRLSKGVTLTDEGKALYDYVRQSLMLLAEGEAKVEALKNLADGQLRIGASDLLFKHLLLPQLEAFRLAYPGVRIRLSHGRSNEIANRTADGQIDIGFVHLPLTQQLANVKLMPFTEINDIFVAGRTFADAFVAGKTLSAAKIAQLPLLLLSPESSTRHYVERWFAAHGVAAEADIELGSIDLLVEFARRGFGVAFVTRSFVAGQLAAGELVELQTEELIPSRQIAVSLREGLPSSLPTARFLTLLGLHLLPH